MVRVRKLAEGNLKPRDVFRVNAGRVQEALRALEEYYKLLGPESVSAVEAIRFQVYELEKAWATQTLGARRRALLQTDLYGITASAFSRGRDNVTVAKAMLEAGIRIVHTGRRNSAAGRWRGNARRSGSSR